MVFEADGAACTEAPKLDRAQVILETTEGETEPYRVKYFTPGHTTSK